MKVNLFIRGALPIAVLLLGSAVAVNAEDCDARVKVVPGSPREVLVDRCSVQVMIKVPFADDSNPSSKDVIFDRTGGLKSLPFTVIEQLDSKSFSAWSDPISPVPANKDGFIRWFCGTAAERSRCPARTKSIRARIGPDRCLQIACY